MSDQEQEAVSRAIRTARNVILTQASTLDACAATLREEAARGEIPAEEARREASRVTAQATAIRRYLREAEETAERLERILREVEEADSEHEGIVRALERQLDDEKQAHMQCAGKLGKAWQQIDQLRKENAELRRALVPEGAVASVRNLLEQATAALDRLHDIPATPEGER